MTTADTRRLGYVGSVPTDRQSNDWYTPAPYIDSVTKVLGGIDLDPFTPYEANKIVKARMIYTERDDAFAQNWKKASAQTAFMNPPYSGTLVKKAMHRFMDEFAAKTFTSGIVLVNNATETQWFQRALREADAVCFTDHRISFWNSDGKAISGNTRGQAFFLFGGSRRKFRYWFSQHGEVVFL